ncbi:hypothetical protein [Shimia biformata]|uniref:hypothetical protein n=1 Tax=Shimia biformata TaxID=1294299 RepID=UPI00194E0C66|nr:hypothetical protein [Shimia biformata]
MFKRILSTALLFGMAATAPPAFAANCAMRDALVDHLETKFAESLTAAGLQAGSGAQTMVEVWSSDATGTFTVIVTNARGVSCVVATGTDWFQTDPTPMVTDSPS